MFKSFAKFCFVLLVGFGFMGLTSCSSDDDSSLDLETVDNYVDQSVFAMQSERKIGRFGCYEMVFPITIEFPDASTTSVDDYEQLKETIKSWIQENAENLDLPPRDSMRRRCHRPLNGVDRADLPSLVYPIEIITEDGETVSVASAEELKELRIACARDFFDGRGKPCHRRGFKCFKLVFPVTIEFPDESQFSAASKQALKTVLREWKSNNPDAEERPELVFPVNIEFKDGSTAEVASKEALAEIKDACEND